MFWAQNQDLPCPSRVLQDPRAPSHLLRAHQVSFQEEPEPCSSLQLLLLLFLLRCPVFEPWEGPYASPLFSGHLPAMDTKASTRL